MMAGNADNVGGVSPHHKSHDVPPSDDKGSGQVSLSGINPGKLTLDDLKLLFQVEYGPEKGKEKFHQFQMMIFSTCLSQMNIVKPKKHDIREDYQG